ncbi:MAG: ABC transporter substrate-binding protein [Alphaproteobacteria bacterium]|nr:ABC transporter substrate-binding protein [Alphaproteobacteria bacterium]
MRRRAVLITGAGASATFLPSRTLAQTRRIARLAVLSPGTNAQRPVFAAFRARLAELGYVEGRDVTLAFHLAGGAEMLPEFAQTIARDGADIIVTDGQLASVAMQAVTRTIPIVAVAGFDPVRRGFAASLARPGGNMTGFATISDEIAPKHVEFIREIVPAARRLGVVYAAINQPTHRALEQRAAELGLALRHIVIATREDAVRELASPAIADVDGLVLPANPIIAGIAGDVVALINAAGKPASYGDRDFVAAGGLVFFSYDIDDVYRQVAGYVDRILRGTKPGDLPFEQPSRIQLVVNLGTARGTGIAIPQSLLARADEVID